MGLIPTFTDHADQNGLFVAQIDLCDLNSYKGRYIKFLDSAATELDIRIGVNETETGLEVGFETLEDYQATMDIVQPKFGSIIDRLNSAIDRYANSDAPNRSTKPRDFERGEDFGDFSR